MESIFDYLRSPLYVNVLMWVAQTNPAKYRSKPMQVFWSEMTEAGDEASVEDIARQYGCDPANIPSFITYDDPAGIAMGGQHINIPRVTIAWEAEDPAREGNYVLHREGGPAQVVIEDLRTSVLANGKIMRISAGLIKAFWFEHGRSSRISGPPQVAMFQPWEEIDRAGNIVARNLKNVTANWTTRSGRTVPQARLKELCREHQVHIDLSLIKSVFLNESDQLVVITEF